MYAQKSMKSRSNARAISYSRVKFYLAIKRLLDIVISIILLLLLTPAIILISYWLYKKQARPIFTRQLRTGKNNRLFLMRTFRTMTNPSQVIQELPPLPILDLWANGIPNEFIPKTNGHTTMTTTGKTLLKYGLQKLPQFVHVLKGDMSLIGPNAEVPEITKYYNDYQILRLNIRPGMIGYAKVYQSSKDHQQEITQDLHYLKHCSFTLDVKIIFLAMTNKMKQIKSVHKG